MLGLSEYIPVPFSFGQIVALANKLTDSCALFEQRRPFFRITDNYGERKEAGKKKAPRDASRAPYEACIRGLWRGSRSTIGSYGRYRKSFDHQRPCYTHDAA